MSIAECLFRRMESFYDERRFADLVIDVQGHTFHCHKIILSAVSEFFNAMYSSGMKESTSDKITLKDIQALTFGEILAYVYKGRNIINEDNVEELFRTASMLQINCLQERCEEFMVRKIDMENCVGVWKLAKATCCNELESTCLAFILRNFDEVRLNDEFLQLEKDDVASIIKCNDLKVSDEENVYSAILHWVEADEHCRQDFFPELFAHLRLSNLRLDYILDEISEFPMVVDSPSCSKIVRDALKFHSMPFRRQELSHLQDDFRYDSFKEKVLAITGRRLKEESDSSLEIIAYSFAQGRWFSLSSPTLDMGEEFAACSYGNDLYITGGTKHFNAAFKYSSKLSKWKKIASLTNGRYRHSMVAVRDHLYVLGGYDFGTLKNVECYDMETDKWKNAGELVDAVDGSSAAAIGNKIYVFGGWLGFAAETSAIQCFDITTNTCVKVCSLPMPAKCTRALVSEKRVEIVTSEGEIVSFSQNSSKILGVIPKFSRKNYGIFKDGKTLCVLGGDDISTGERIGDSSSLNVYSIAGRDVTVRDNIKLPTDMEIQGCFNIVMDKSGFLNDFEIMINEFDI